jgi:hypothetical protein
MDREGPKRPRYMLHLDNGTRPVLVVTSITAQKPGGLTRWLTRVHLGNSVSPFSAVPQHSKQRPTVNALPIPPLFSIEDGVFVFRQHLLFPRHLLVPSLNSFRSSHTVTLKSSADGVDYFIDHSQSFPLSSFLGRGESPWSFPEAHEFVSVAGGVTYQSRPPNKRAVGRNMA